MLLGCLQGHISIKSDEMLTILFVDRRPGFAQAKREQIEIPRTDRFTQRERDLVRNGTSNAVTLELFIGACNEILMDRSASSCDC